MSTEPRRPELATGSGSPTAVSDLQVTAVTDTSVTLAFTEVDDGTGQPAKYDLRYAVAPISWGSAPSVAHGTCATPVAGTAIGAKRSCTVLGLSRSTTYEFQLVPYRGTLNVDAVFGTLSNIVRVTTAAGGGPLANECAALQTGWIWCDDFEQDRLSRYFEYNNAAGNFVRALGVGVDGSSGMRARWATTGQVFAGFLHLAFGKTPQTYFRPVDAGTAVYRDVYWRMYVRHQSGWVGGGADKLSRATSFASTTSWAQAMIAHVWSGTGTKANLLVIDPASGTDEAGNLRTTQYNDGANLRWLGGVTGVTPLFDPSHVGQWHCVETHARLNDPGLSNGVFELWVDGNLDARRSGLNWVGSFSAYGINAVFVENYWNAGAPQPEERYFDNLVVSAQRIGCGGSAPPPPAPVSTVTVSPATATLQVGGTVQLVATAMDASGNLLAGRTVAWASSNTAVATVSGAGLVTAMAGGSATITAEVEGVRGTASVGVTVPVATVEVSPATASGTVGQSGQFTATLKDAVGNVLSGRTLTWSSSNTAVVTVDQTGLATAVGGGSAEITATSEGKTGRASVTVTSPGVAVATVEVSPATVSDAVGTKRQFAAVLKDAAGNVLAGRTVTWSSSNTAVGTVDQTGLASALAAGSVTVTATSEGKSGSATWTIKVPVASVTVSPATASGTVGQSGQFTATVKDAAGNVLTDRPVIWSSSNTAVVTVDAKGWATAVGGGSAAIMATCEGKTGQAQVTVSGTATSAPVASVTVSPSTASVTVGTTQQFTAVLKDANGNILTGRTVTWSSSSSLIATVSGAGLVTALAAGTATITATSEGRSGTAVVTVTLLPPPPPPPGSEAWPNEPVGFTTITDWAFDALVGGGWNMAWNDAGLVTIAPLADAPLSPSNVGQWRYPAGYTGGGAPGTMYRGLPSPRELYVGYWWKPSRPWQAHPSNVNKLSFVTSTAGQNLVLDMYGAGEPYQLMVTTQFGIEPSRNLWPNVNNPAVALGEWHRIELYAKHSTTETSRDGIIRWWLDGVLVGNYTDLNFMSAPWGQFAFSPTWGGVGGTKTQTDYFWYDDVRLSMK